MNKLNEIQHQALLRVQWSGNRADAQGPYCPLCGGYSGFAGTESVNGHKPTCAVAAAIQSYNDTKTALLLTQPSPIDQDSRVNVRARKFGE